MRLRPIAAVYARKSTDQSGVADQQKSVARQIQHARGYAVRKGWLVADEHVYVDDGISRSLPMNSSEKAGQRTRDAMVRKAQSA